MPKFSENEKAIIQEKLFAEGERLFTIHGIKKVTVEDLVKAAGIAKGSFYAFFANKEQLYMEIAGRLQEKMWRDMDGFLIKNRSLPPVTLAKECFLWMFAQLHRYPMLKQANSETAEYLYRKLPPEVIAAHTKEDSYELMQLQKYGVTFKCDIQLATKALQSLAISFLSLQQDDAATQGTIMDLMLNGILTEIVSDEDDLR